MNHALAARTPRTGLRLAQALRERPYAVYTVVVAAVLGCGIAIANMQSPAAARSHWPVAMSSAQAGGSWK